MQTGKRQLIRRLALLVALLCFWMSSGAALHHTDDMSAFRAFAAGHSTAGHAVHSSSTSPDGCAACEWQKTIPPLHARTADVGQQLSRLSSPTPCAADAMHLRAFDHFSLRAPPTFTLS